MLPRIRHLPAALLLLFCFFCVVLLSACDGKVSITAGPGKPAIILGTNGQQVGVVGDESAGPSVESGSESMEPSAESGGGSGSSEDPGSLNPPDDPADESDSSGSANDSGSLPGTSSEFFPDVPADAWYASALKICSMYGIISGLDDGSFGPDLPVTRGTLVYVLHRAAGFPVAEMWNAFSDLSPDDWYFTAVRWAASRSLISGYADGTFGANDPVTREQALTVLWRYSGMPTSENVLTAAEAEEVSPYAREAVNWALSSGHIRADTDDELNAKDLLTRAELVVLLDKCLYGGIGSAASDDPLVSSSGPYPDVPEDMWCAFAVDWCRHQGILRGADDGTFRPNEPMTRAMFLTGIFLAAGSPASNVRQLFQDVPSDAWYTDAVRWALENKIIQTTWTESLNPEEPLRRDQALSILWRAGGHPDVSGDSSFSDASHAASYAKTAVLWAEQKRLVTGGGDSLLRPGDLLTRAEAAVLLERYVNGQ